MTAAAGAGQRDSLHTLTNIRTGLDDLERRAQAMRSARAGIIATLTAGGMTMAEIAEYCGVTRQAVHYWSKT